MPVIAFAARIPNGHMIGTIIAFVYAAEHLYGVKLTSYFLTIPYQPFLTIAFLCFFTFLTGTFPLAVNTKRYA